MLETGIAKLFRNGRSQAVRLPREFRFEGNQVRVRRLTEGVLLQPLIADPAEWFAELDRLREGHFLSKGKNKNKGRNQPETPSREIFK
jgi:antitoxin VapB